MPLAFAEARLPNNIGERGNTKLDFNLEFVKEVREIKIVSGANEN